MTPRKIDPDLCLDGQKWPRFGYTMLGLRRLDNVQQAIEDILERKVPGDLIETGVWRGGCTIFMRAILKHYGVTDRTVWVADSFQGNPKPNTAVYGEYAGWDLSEEECFRASLEEVKANFARFGLLDQHVQFLKGWFRDTLPNAPIQKLALLRLDGDLYESTMDALRALYHRVSPGGYVIVDDYHDWPSCKKAVEDFRRDKGITTPIEDVDSHAVFWIVPEQ